MDQKALWSGRFDGDLDDSTLGFTSSLDVDVRMAYYDIMGSLAHVKMLGATGILPSSEVSAIIKGLKDILKELEEGRLKLDDKLEDIHTNVEFRLTETIGPTGGRLHTGRSRNDQVATDFRMYLRDATLGILRSLENLQRALISKAEEHLDTVMPGFTHMQHAQPVTLAYHLMTHCFRLQRDSDRFLDAYKRLNVCPLGSAALAGTTYPIDRRMTAELLGFARPTENAMDGVSDRDFALELAFCASATAVHLSSMAEELILWSGPEFGFVEMDDAYSTGSSIMPQKKNPDIAELVRGRCGKISSGLFNLLMLMKGLPLAYNRDMQEDKEPVMTALATLLPALEMSAPMIATMKVKEERMESVTEEGFINATDMADYLVLKGVPFREAHGIVGKAVRHCIAHDKRLEDMSLTEMQEMSPLIEDDIFQVIPVRRCVERRSSYGGPARESVEAQFMEALSQMTRRREQVDRESERLQQAMDALRQL